MTRRIEFHVGAQAELERALAHYESRESGLGERFLAEARRILSVIAEYPEIGAPIWKTRRRVLLDRFQSRSSIVFPAMARSGSWP